jgi:cupin 2 domain-containing protein
MKSDNIFESIPSNLDDEFTELLLQNEGVSIERIVSRGHASPDSGWYDQERNEWVLLLKGAAIIAFENGDEITLASGDHINIPAHRKHRVKWTDPETETFWLAVFY